MGSVIVEGLDVFVSGRKVRKIIEIGLEKSRRVFDLRALL